MGKLGLQSTSVKNNASFAGDSAAILQARGGEIPGRIPILLIRTKKDEPAIVVLVSFIEW